MNATPVGVTPPAQAADHGGGTGFVLESLSPSRASDFMTCPLLFRFRTVDRLPEPPSPEAARGTLVHAVLERLFDLPAEQRTPAAARELLAPAWADLVAAEPELAAVLPAAAGPPADAHAGAEAGVETGAASAEADWLAATHGLLDAYFRLEDPRRLEPAERELGVSATLGSGLTLRGIIDRLDRAPDGALRVVDYKTGRSPSERFEQKVLFQLRCYGLALWRASGQVPRVLQLMYLANGEILRFEPAEADLRATERTLEALRVAIERAGATGDWRPSPSRLCDWCAHRALCPAWGGTPPPLPVTAPEASAAGPSTAGAGRGEVAAGDLG